MASITIKDVPRDVHGRLKERARINRRSLQQEILSCLEAVVVPGRGHGAQGWIDLSKRLEAAIGKDLDHRLVAAFKRKGLP